MSYPRNHFTRSIVALLPALSLAFPALVPALTQQPSAPPKGTTQPVKVLSFAGYDWEVRAAAGLRGPGPNLWDERNVWLDDEGGLHLKLAQRDGKWTCASVTSSKRFGFGRYSFKIEGAVDRLDPQVVCGLFLYPTEDVGPDATHEIDIEFARWGKTENPNGNYSVWPTQLPAPHISHRFPVALDGAFTTHGWIWRADEIRFQSQHGHRDDDGATFAQWKFAPESPLKSISQKPMPMHFNLWLFRGGIPTDGKEVEVVIRGFKYEPLPEHRKQPAK